MVQKARRSEGQQIGGARQRVIAGALSIFLGIGAMSCGDRNVDCDINPVFTDSQQQDIHRAGAAWDAFTTRKVSFDSSGDWLIIQAETPTGLGYEQSKRHLIRIRPDTPNDQIYAVALHELGHALGLGHVSQGVMDPNHQTIVFSTEDFAECRRVDACQ